MTALLNNELVLNAYLELGNRFRSNAVKTCDEGKEQADRTGLESTVLRNILLPRYVYVVTITTVSRVNDAGPAHTDILGYMVVDSTAKSACPELDLLMRIGELLIYRQSRHHTPARWVGFEPRRSPLRAEKPPRLSWEDVVEDAVNDF